MIGDLDNDTADKGRRLVEALRGGVDRDYLRCWFTHAYDHPEQSGWAHAFAAGGNRFVDNPNLRKTPR
jgi:hypothetical protein